MVFKSPAVQMRNLLIFSYPVQKCRMCKMFWLLCILVFLFEIFNTQHLTQIPLSHHFASMELKHFVWYYVVTMTELWNHADFENFTNQNNRKVVCKSAHLVCVCMQLCICYWTATVFVEEPKRPKGQTTMKLPVHVRNLYPSRSQSSISPIKSIWNKHLKSKNFNLHICVGNASRSLRSMFYDLNKVKENYKNKINLFMNIFKYEPTLHSIIL